MEKIVKQALLFDFYGELLTEHQKNIYEDIVSDDYSISEVAASQGVSRQSVSDLIKRCNKLLEGYEEKLKLVEKFINTREMVDCISTQIQKYKEDGDAGRIDEIDRVSRKILDEL